MAAQRDYATPRLDDEDVEGGEQTRLLGETSPQTTTTTTHQAQRWTEYPAQWWAQSREYVNDWQKKRTDRGKQRQQDIDQHRNGGLSASRTDNDGLQSRFRQLRQESPRTFFALIALSVLISIIAAVIVVLSVHLFAFTLRSPDDATQQRILARSFNIDGPDNVQVLGVTDDGVTIQVDGRIGIDADAALDEWLGERSQVGWWTRKDRDIVEWAVNKVKGVQVDVQTLSIRSPDWSVKRPIDRVHLIPDDGKGKEDELHALKKVAPPVPTDLITFDFEPLLIPVPSVGARQRASTGKKKAPEADTPVTMTFVVNPSGPSLASYAEYTLQNKTAYLDIQVKSARVRGLNAKDWLRGAASSSSWWSMAGWVNARMPESWKRLAQTVPKIGGGNDTNPDEFLNLTRYDFQEIGGPNDDYPERALGLDIFAEAMNPLGKLLKGHVGYSLPFGAFLPVLKKNDTTAPSAGKQPADVVLLAAVATEPFDIHGEKKIPLRLHGRVIPPPTTLLQKRDQKALLTSNGDADAASADGNAAADALSDFLSRFLRGESNTLYVRGGSPFAEPKTKQPKGTLPMPGGGSDDLPAWLDRLLRVASVPISFPGSKVTDLIQNVTINDLKITPHPFETDKLVCSGVIMGVMNMPGQLATVDVAITDLWPDVLIFNGKPPGMKKPKEEQKSASNKVKHTKRKHGDGDDGDDDDTPTPDPLPDPLPEHAFGRVVPHKWAPATTYIDPEDPKGKRKLLRSELKNVPFTVLPGRGAEFRSFSWKIVTGEGALAGIDGKAKAKIWNSGLGKLTLSNLPVQGLFTVGKRGGGGGDDGDDDGDDGFMPLTRS